MTSINKGVGTNITTSTLVQSQPGAVLIEIFVSAASATPTITIYDSATAATNNKVVDTFTPTAATAYLFNMVFQNGIYIVISGTVSCTPVTT